MENIVLINFKFLSGDLNIFIHLQTSFLKSFSNFEFLDFIIN